VSAKTCPPPRPYTNLTCLLSSIDETAVTIPVNVEVVESNSGNDEPTPTQVEFNTTVTGSPFETTVTSTGSQTVTSPPQTSSTQSAGIEQISRNSIMWTMLGAVIFLVMAS
jgi:hypothetical protein